MNFGARGGLFGMGAAARAPLEFAVRGPIARADVSGLCDRVDALLAENRSDVVVCDVHGVEPDAVTVDALARLQLAARRYGCRVRLRGASPELCDVVSFMGLCDALRVEPRRKPERRKQPLGVEEER
jgi:STAS domain